METTRTFDQSWSDQKNLSLLCADRGLKTNELFRPNAYYEIDLVDVIYRPGRVPPQQLPTYFRAADIYLKCAVSDGSSVSVLEAMGTGLPVLATDNACNREWITPGKNCFLSPVADSQLFAKKLLRALDLANSELDAVSLRSRLLIEQKANWNNYVSDLFAVKEALVL